MAASFSVAAAISLIAYPSNLLSSPTTVNVSWSGVVGAQSTDWIASYCLGEPVGSWSGTWVYVDTCAEWATGSCTIDAWSLDYANFNCQEFEFRMYRDPSPYRLLVTGNPIKWSGPAESNIRHTRISYGRQPQTQMHFSWTSDDAITPGSVQLGTSPGVYDMPSVPAARPLTYAASDSCGSPSAFSPPGYFYHALITGLQPATRYYARAAQGVSNASIGPEVTWVTGKPVGPGVQTAFVVYADMYVSGGAGAVGTAERVAARVNGSTPQDPPLDFLLHVGDISYGEGDTGVWEDFMGLIAPYSGTLPYHVSIGNHEYDYPSTQDGSKDPSGAGRMWSPPFWNGGSDSGGECGMPTSRRFRVPETGNGVFWYSFEVGNVHVAMISSEHDPSPGSPLGDWLAADLLAVDRALTPWLLLGIHRPLVETEQYASDYAVAAGLRAILEPLLLRARVDVVLAGHYHSFQRSCAMANLQCVAKGGIVHYTTGAAGAGLDGGDACCYNSSYIDRTILQTYGYSIVSAPNASAMSLTFFANVNDSAIDQVWLYK